MLTLESSNILRRYFTSWCYVGKPQPLPFNSWHEIIYDFIWIRPMYVRLLSVDSVNFNRMNIWLAWNAMERYWFSFYFACLLLRIVGHLWSVINPLQLVIMGCDCWWIDELFKWITEPYMTHNNWLKRKLLLYREKSGGKQDNNCVISRALHEVSLFYGL